MTNEQLILKWSNKMGLGGLSEDQCATLENFCAFVRAALTPPRQIGADNAGEAKPVKYCSDEHPCINCFADQGECLDKPGEIPGATAALRELVAAREAYADEPKAPARVLRLANASDAARALLAATREE